MREAFNIIDLFAAIILKISYMSSEMRKYFVVVFGGSFILKFAGVMFLYK